MKKKHIHYDTNAAIFRQKASKEELRFKFIRLILTNTAFCCSW